MDSSKFKKVDTDYKKKKKKHANNSYQQNQTLNKNYYKKRKQNHKLKNSKRNYLYPKQDKKKKRSGINLKIIGVIFLIIIVGLVAFMSINMFDDVSYSALPGDAVLVYPSDFDFKPDAYYFDSTLYGNFVGTNENGTQSYFLTQEQVFILAYNSNNTFNYSNGIYVTYDKESTVYNDINVVKDIYLEDGTRLSVPDDYDSDTFIKNSKKIASNTKFCTKTFGYSGDDYYKIY